MHIYCGDYTHLPNSYHKMGSRRECLQKGIGVGKYLSPSEKERIKSAHPSSRPTLSQKVYCGDLPSIPSGYHRAGTRSECLKKGVGIGSRIEITQEEQDKATIKKIALLLSINPGRKGKQRLIDEIIETLSSK